MVSLPLQGVNTGIQFIGLVSRRSSICGAGCPERGFGLPAPATHIGFFCLYNYLFISVGVFLL